MTKSQKTVDRSSAVTLKAMKVVEARTPYLWYLFCTDHQLRSLKQGAHQQEIECHKLHFWKLLKQQERLQRMTISTEAQDYSYQPCH